MFVSHKLDLDIQIGFVDGKFINLVIVHLKHIQYIST